ncbi:hypothetical protein GC176_12500 [bacterium]|nr:hypothetical protein [bacterium]
MLVVADEETVLVADQLRLKDRFEIDVVISGEAGLGRITTDGSSAVIASNMKIAGVNSAGFLRQVQTRSRIFERLSCVG